MVLSRCCWGLTTLDAKYLGHLPRRDSLKSPRPLSRPSTLLISKRDIKKTFFKSQTHRQL